MIDRWNTGRVENFISFLIASNVFNDATGKRLLTALNATGHPLDTVVIELGLMREEVLARAMANYLKIELSDQLPAKVDIGVAQTIGVDFQNTRAILPLKSPSTGALLLAVADPFDTSSTQMVSYLLDRPIAVTVATRSAIVTAVAATMFEDNISEVASGIEEGPHEGDLEKLRDFAQQAPIVRLVARIAQNAADAHATDIHIEPFEHEIRIRIRVDGVLKVIDTVPASFLPGISTRLKILANLDISERRLPQDGRIRIAVRGQEIDMRISFIPAIHGETIVMRLLDRSAVALDLKGLGFDGPVRAKLEHIARLPNGIVLITGPTGSGKTTTLYALMSILNDPAVKIFTVEDPVEYQMAGITQLQINNATGMTFARALRSVLRQDPDIILVGEIRDRETAEIAMQAALTGHLVLSTLHTNSAIGAITRLRDMGMENYLIGSTLKGIVGQRLVRKSCRCQNSVPTRNCETCSDSGYIGRTVVHETVSVNDVVARMISENESVERILLELQEDGFKTMEEHARLLVADGITTTTEVARAIRFEDKVTM